VCSGLALAQPAAVSQEALAVAASHEKCTGLQAYLRPQARWRTQRVAASSVRVCSTMVTRPVFAPRSSHLRCLSEPSEEAARGVDSANVRGHCDTDVCTSGATVISINAGGLAFCLHSYTIAMDFETWPGTGLAASKRQPIVGSIVAPFTWQSPQSRNRLRSHKKSAGFIVCPSSRIYCPPSRSFVACYCYVLPPLHVVAAQADTMIRTSWPKRLCRACAERWQFTYW